MSGDGASLYCPRCDRSVVPIRVWRGFKWCWRAWVVGFSIMLVMTPFLAYDFCVLIPGMMIYTVAGSPLRALARTAPACRRCSLDLEEGRTTGTPLKRA